MAGHTSPRRLAAGLCLSLVSLCGAVVALELGLRLRTFGTFEAPVYGYHLQIFDRHPTRGWKLKPGVATSLRTLDFTVDLATNSKGYRDVEHALEKPPGTFRVVVLGDSFMEAGQVSFEQAFCRVLEDQLTGPRDVEVVNLGVSGYGPAQELLALQEEGLLYDPDVVLLALFIDNDLRNIHPELERRLGFLPNRPFASVLDDGTIEMFKRESKIEYMDLPAQQKRYANKQKAQKWWKRTLLYDRWEKAKTRVASIDEKIPKYDPNVWLGIYATRFDPSLATEAFDSNEFRRYWDESLDLLETLLEEVRDVTEESGARLVVFTVPARVQVDDEYLRKLDERYPSLELDPVGANERVVARLRARGLDVLDLVEVFRETHAGAGIGLHHVIEDDHWNVDGHGLAAAAVADHVRELMGK